MFDLRLISKIDNFNQNKMRDKQILLISQFKDEFFI